MLKHLFLMTQIKINENLFRDSNGNADLTAPFARVYTQVFELLPYVGFTLVIAGCVAFGFAHSHGDTQKRSLAVGTIVVGIVMIGLRVILSAFGIIQ